jgi:hypothetical protein
MVRRSEPDCETISDQSQAIFDCHTKASHSSAVVETSQVSDGSAMAYRNAWLPHVMSFEKVQIS